MKFKANFEDTDLDWCGPNGFVMMHMHQIHLVFKTEYDTSGEVLSDRFKAQTSKPLSSFETQHKCHSYEDTRLSASWLEALTGTTHSIHQRPHVLLKPPWYLSPGKGRARYQSRETSQAKPVHPPRPGHQPRSSQWKISPSLSPGANRQVSTAALSVSHDILPHGHAGAKTLTGEFLDENRSLSWQTIKH